MNFETYITDCSLCIDKGGLRGSVEFRLLVVDLEVLEPDMKLIAEAVLATEEQEKFKTYTFAKRQREWLGGRLVCKEAVAQISGLSDLQSIVILNGEHGRPFVQREGRQNVHVSISHSGQFAMALACNVPCGLDLQEVTPALDRVREKFILPEEQKLLTQFSGSSNVKLGQVWAVKEALRKQVDLWPLLGFLEMRLEQVHNCGNGFKVCCSSVDNDRKLPQNLPDVFATMYKKYALAVSFGS